MPAVAQTRAAIKPESVSSTNLLNKFDSRKSDEIVIALAGPIGCGISTIAEELKSLLIDKGYKHVIHIKLSEFLEQGLRDGFITEPSIDGSDRFKRYRRLQEAGKTLRESLQNPAVLSEYATQEITKDRRRRAREAQDQPTSDGPLVPERVAYLIDQVKRPEEVRLLRAIYRNLFYLLGVTRINEKRKAELERESVNPAEAQNLIEIDKNEAGNWGQQIDKTLHLADYIIRNDASNIDTKRKKLHRFLSLVHGDSSISPTDAEHGMYAAYAAGLRSACLSRQVGAAITSKSGELLATGCNDVPKAGGGLYSASSSGADMRCLHMDGERCFNDLHKEKLKSEIGDTIKKTLNEQLQGIELDGTQFDILLNNIYSNTRIKSLIEFSRSVHAEMDAITSLARIGGSGLEGASLYTTTFPCHNCARHIVASGIMKVFYIEPYEKSLAKDLHDDSIAFEVEESSESKPKRVEFLHYEGVSPSQFHNFFRAPPRKDKTGKFIKINARDAEKTLPEYLDNYQDFEKKTVEHLSQELANLKANPRQTGRS